MIVKIVTVIYYIMLYTTLFYSIYFTFTGFLGVFKKNKVKFPKTEQRHHFAILVPARNEEEIIANLIASLKKQNYPQDKYDIYVIPNNCTDDTANVAKKAGAKVLECTVPTKTKGDVLNFVFDELKDNKEIDAYVIFDADNVVHPEFLMRMNECLASGFNVAEGYRDAKNPSDNWLSGSYTIFYLFQNVMFNRSRMAIGGSSSINGTGFMIRKEYVDENGFETYTLTEDCEYTGLCALKGERIAFVEDAITYDEYPVKFKASWVQRRRWSSGVMECFFRYSPKLFWNFLKNGGLPSLDMSIVYFGPFFQLFNFFNILIIFILAAFGIYLGDGLTAILVSSVWHYVGIYVLWIVLELFLIIYKKKKIKPILSGIFLFPIFVITWVPINIVCLLFKQTKWVAIKHDRKVDIDEAIQKSK